MPVSTKKAEYIIKLPIWRQCRDVVAGSWAVKRAKDTYLPVLSGHEGGLNGEDYKQFLNRSQFFNGTSRTVEAYEGMIFTKEPQVDVPEQLGSFIENPTKDMKNFNMVLKEIVNEVVKVNRIGVLIDVPRTDGETLTIAEATAQKIEPSWVFYKAETIINWQTDIIGNEQKLTLVTLAETRSEVIQGDIFDVKVSTIFRVLKLTPEGYEQQIYKENEVTPSEIITPLMDGKRMDFIPFYILDITGINYENIPMPVIYDLSEVNIGHYRNSGDYEGELHKVASKSIVVIGGEENQKFKVGGLNIISNTEAKVELLEASQNSGLALEMEKKEKRMAVLGSQVIAQKTNMQESAEFANISNKGEESILASISNAVSRSCEIMLRMTGKWMPISIADDAEIIVQLNTDFNQKRLSPQDQIALMQQVQAGLIDWDTYLDNFRQGEIIPESKTNEDIKLAAKNNPQPDDGLGDLGDSDSRIIEDSQNRGDDD
jgi:hypothetical protein